MPPMPDTLRPFLTQQLRTGGIVLLLLGAMQATSAQPAPEPEAPLKDRVVLLESLNVRDADLRDVFRGIAHQYDLNLAIDNRIDRRVTVRLSNVPVLDAVAYLCKEHGLKLTQQGAIYRIEVPPAPPPQPPEPVKLAVRDSLLTVDLKEEDLARFVQALGQQSGVNVVVRQGVLGKLSGTLRDVPFEVGLRTLLENNGFTLRRKDGIYHVDREEADEGQPPRRAWVEVKDGLVTGLRAGVTQVTASIAGKQAAHAEVVVLAEPGSVEILSGDVEALARLITERAALPAELRAPVMVCAFKGWNDAGEAASAGSRLRSAQRRRTRRWASRAPSA